MRLTVHTDYALRLLMLLAMEPKRIHTIEEVAQRYNISRNHLMKVTQTLAQADFVNSQRGRGGGLTLQRNAADINLGDIVRATEDGFELVECFNAMHNKCLISSACGLRDPLTQALEAFLAVLDGYSLADLMQRPGSIRRLRAILTAAE